jgi:hypothetical protein
VGPAGRNNAFELNDRVFCGNALGYVLTRLPLSQERSGQGLGTGRQESPGCHTAGAFYFRTTARSRRVGNDRFFVIDSAPRKAHHSMPLWQAECAMTAAQDCQRKAEECLRLAREAKTDIERQQLIEMANSWIQAAALEDDKETAHEAASRKAKPQH